MNRAHIRVALITACVLVTVNSAWADQHTTGVPQLSSRPGAAYTIYLDVAGFNYDGSWRGSTNNPGVTPAVNDVASNGTFSAADQAQIAIMWSRLAQSYIGLNVNVTTVDPAIAAGQAATDAQRQAFYDATPNLMHTVAGSQDRAALVGLPDNNGATNNSEGKWYSIAADGVSGLGVAAGRVDGPNSVSGDHTNWMFTEDQAGAATGGVINGDYIGAISAHENGHAFGLSHQGDWQGNTVVNVYTNGDANPGNGSYVAIIGGASDRQRVTWRVGDTTQDTHTVVNDVQHMLVTDTILGAGAESRSGAADLHLINDGIGHSRLLATALAITGDTVNFNAAKGVIVPLSETDPQPIDPSNYTKDWFSFTLGSASSITLTCTDGTEFLTPGVADGAGTLRSTLGIYDLNGILVGSAIEDSSTLFETYSGNLAAGTYYAAVASFGGHVQDSPTFNAATYFDMGAFFLTGTGFSAAVVPEPASLAMFSLGAIFLIRRRARN